ncbi:MarR family winged helix-turn-helix transcriptional regulator [uncultured Mycobacterium sp.]|uniref:MarR family winged helix-turn-helix transcriptional regulator n=1 Tax=uncultured Mycobacterium sp. TaxID=171292 RepID=UPI0035CC4AE2
MEQSQTERAVGYLVKRVQQALRRRCDAALKPTGLSMAQYAVLRALADHPDASAAELARRCFVTRQSLQDVLAGLRATRLIETVDAPPRGRARALCLTRRGSRLLATGDDAVFGVEAAMLEGISRAARRSMASVLQRCAENLESF